MIEPTGEPPAPAPLHRRITLLQAVSLNMAMMVGVGPFITIPLFFKTMGGPHALVGWVAGAVVALCDGLVWCELAAAFPGTGGTFHFYHVIYKNSLIGRLLKFLFVWQFLISGPMELATGGIGLGQYTGFLFPWLKEPAWSIPALSWEVTRGQVLAVFLVLGFVALAYRRIEVAGRLMVVLWAGMLVTMGGMIATGLAHFDPGMAFELPPGAWTLDGRFAFGLGGALAIAMYDFLGYYQVCYLGDEVVDPSRTLPRAVLIAVAAVSSLYLALSLSILGVVPFPDLVTSSHIASDFIDRTLGGHAAIVVTGLILWTGGASLFAGLLGYSRVPYAAALSGDFYRGLASTHPRGGFPDRSLVLLGGLTALACLFDLTTVIAALLASRLLIQFLGQIGTLAHVHRRPELRARLRFRMWLYPVPPIVAAIGWSLVLATTEPRPLVFAALTMTAGLAAFLVWDRGSE